MEYVKHLRFVKLDGRKATRHSNSTISRSSGDRNFNSGPDKEIKKSDIRRGDTQNTGNVSFEILESISIK
jgi:hypothetical protein